VVVLALKPAGLMLAAEAAKRGEVVISMLGATSEQKLREAMPDVDVLRLMPNLGVEKGRGTLCLSHHDSIEAAQVEKVTSLLSLLGKVVEMADEDMDAATAVMGCTPAYFALAAKRHEAGAKDGLVPGSPCPWWSIDGRAAELLGSSPGALREAVIAGRAPKQGSPPLTSTSRRRLQTPSKPPSTACGNPCSALCGITVGRGRSPPTSWRCSSSTSS
jgi:hypothetical protein